MKTTTVPPEGEGTIVFLSLLALGLIALLILL